MFKTHFQFFIVLSISALTKCKDSNQIISFVEVCRYMNNIFILSSYNHNFQWMINDCKPNVCESFMFLNTTPALRYEVSFIFVLSRYCQEP